MAGEGGGGGAPPRREGHDLPHVRRGPVADRGLFGTAGREYGGPKAAAPCQARVAHGIDAAVTRCSRPRLSRYATPTALDAGRPELRVRHDAVLPLGGPRNARIAGCVL